MKFIDLTFPSQPSSMDANLPNYHLLGAELRTELAELRTPNAPQIQLVNQEDVLARIQYLGELLIYRASINLRNQLRVLRRFLDKLDDEETDDTELDDKKLEELSDAMEQVRAARVFYAAMKDEVEA
jgi:hypothetical protein